MSIDVQQLFRDAVAAHRSGDHKTAVSVCESILFEAGASAEVLNLKAVALAESGQMVLARQSIMAALEISEGKTSDEMRSILFVHAARIFSALDLYQDAVYSARKAVKLRPSDPSCAYQNSRMELLSGNLGRARAIINQCVADFPDFTEARMLMAQIAMEQGNLEEATDCYQEIIEKQPKHARGWAGLAEIGNVGTNDNDVFAGLTKIHEASVDAENAPGDWATATFALADACARDQQYEKALGLYHAANERLAKVNNWDLPGWQTRVENIVANAELRVASGTSSSMPRPVFIVGMPRSGSSLLERMVSAHSTVSASGERESMWHIERYLEYSGTGTAASGAGLVDQQVEEMRELYRSGFSETSDVDWYCDKANQNFERIGLIRRLFPESQIIWIVRHPLDTILSCYFQDFQHGLGFTNSLDHLARVYIGHWHLMRKWLEIYGKDIQVIHYDKLVKQPERVMREICTRLDLAYEPAMIQPQLNEQVVRTASTLQVQQPINTTAVGRWRRYESHIGTETRLFQKAGIIDDQERLVSPVMVRPGS
ncbi:MAG TPA: sulfotransferase [Xanthomonadales bacterium]|nr:sulfotransferase [Xanthomonadales bacterium]